MTTKRDPRGQDVFKKLTRDLQSYIGSDTAPWSKPFWKALGPMAYGHLGLLAVVVYRYGQWVKYGCRNPLVRRACMVHYHMLYLWVRTRLQIELPPGADIGPGLRIFHYGGILINSATVAGENLFLNHGVVIGNRSVATENEQGEIIRSNGAPVLGNNVSIKVGAKVFGDITLGNNVTVGAGAVVVKSFPDNVVLVGVPAKVLRIEEKPST